MIARLEGVLLERTPTRVLIGVVGVGYEAAIPLSTFERLPEEGKTVALRIHTHMREGAIQLFGFATEREKVVFEMLLHASRVGPKLAQTILSGIEAEALAEAIRSGDVAALTRVPGVGAKMAERIVVELRDRVDDVFAAPARGPRRGVPASPHDERRAELLSTLANLQVAKPKAERVADAVLAEHGDAPIEDLVRAALRGLAR